MEENTLQNRREHNLESVRQGIFQRNRPIYLGVYSHWSPTRRLVLKSHGKEYLQMIAVILWIWIVDVPRYLCEKAKDAHQNQKENPFQASRNHDRCPHNDHTGNKIDRSNLNLTWKYDYLTLSMRWRHQHPKKMSMSAGRELFFR